MAKMKKEGIPYWVPKNILMRCRWALTALFPRETTWII